MTVFGRMSVVVTFFAVVVALTHLASTSTSTSKVVIVQTPDRLDTCPYGNETYAAGEKFRPDACTSCHCPRHGGRALCTIQDCLWEPHCLRRHRRPDECCGSCLEHGCLHSDGRVYQRGTVISEAKCERCVCPEDGGPSTCSKVKCPEVNCVHPVVDPDQCCPSCPNGDDCWYEKRIIKAGTVVKVGRCKQCQCPDFSSLPHWRRVNGEIHAVCTTRPC